MDNRSEKIVNIKCNNDDVDDDGARVDDDEKRKKKTRLMGHIKTVHV